MQNVTPYLAYADATAALKFLCDMFGFQERFRMDMPDGRIGHAEVTCSGGAIFMSSAWTATGQASPADLGGVHSQVVCRVDDVDAHYAHARAAGAIILNEPADQPYGERTYRAVDPEGHRWIFFSPLRHA
jgi:uncharacterized glyoxalase superfamily protein PhnB